ncbi:hypothetical protein FOA52_006515 [Chlamydomonas sp. UWO 241]|nr:hypothetical protein FOA52_006515 [Chlamydomonas sp. UWO 241]
MKNGATGAMAMPRSVRSGVLGVLTNELIFSILWRELTGEHKGEACEDWRLAGEDTRALRSISNRVRELVDGSVTTADLRHNCGDEVASALARWPGLTSLTAPTRCEVLHALNVAQLPKLHSLSLRHDERLGGALNLPALSLPGLHELEVVNFPNRPALSIEAVCSGWGLQALKKFSVLGFGLSSLAGLAAGFPALQQLCIGSSDVESLAPLQGCTQLLHVDVSNCTRLVSLAGLPAASLTTLQMAGCRSLDGNLQALSACSKLQDLCMDFCISLTSLAQLSGGLQALTRLSMDGCAALTSVFPLAACGSLARLTLDRCSVTEVPLASCRALHELSIGHWHGADLHGLRCPRLRKLSLFHSQLESLEGLEPCVELVELELRDVPNVTSLAPLSGLPQLRRVKVAQAYGVSSLEPLLKCAQLEALAVSAHCDSPGQAALLDALPRLRITRISAVSPAMVPEGEGW